MADTQACFSELISVFHPPITSPPETAYPRFAHEILQGAQIMRKLLIALIVLVVCGSLFAQASTPFTEGCYRGNRIIHDKPPGMRYTHVQE
jgi:hypothetical protein